MKELIEKIEAYLATPAAERDIAAGADLLLSLNRNRILHSNILRMGMRLMDKLEYELNKHLRILKDGYMLKDVAPLENKIVPLIKEDFSPDTQHSIVISSENDNPANFVGKRADHDSLPDEIKDLYIKNGEIYFKMKETYNTLLSLEESKPCDRYEYIVILKELDEKYRKNWEKYDNFRADGEDASQKEEEITPQNVSAARKYLSTHIQDEVEEDAKEEWIKSMQERIDTIQASGGTFKPDFAQKLTDAGLQVTILD